MFYADARLLKPPVFKRLTGVSPDTFSAMSAALAEHLPGGAVDLTLLRVKNGEWLDITSPFEMDETSAPGDVKGLSEEAQQNRRLLFDALEKTGLTNYLGEWWHWSYGDSGWALRTGAPSALYDRLPEGDQ